MLTQQALLKTAPYAEKVPKYSGRKQGIVAGCQQRACWEQEMHWSSCQGHNKAWISTGPLGVLDLVGAHDPVGSES